MVIHRIGGIVCLIIAMLIVSFSPSPACAELNIKELPGNIHLGPVRIHPQFSVTEVYTDNFFLDPRDEKYNWTTVLTPGITVQVPLKRHTFQLDYRSDIFKHCKSGSIIYWDCCPIFD